MTLNPSNTHATTTIRSLLVCALLSIYLSACAVAAVGTVLVTSVDIALDRRTFGTYVDDNAVEIKIRRAFRNDTQIGSNAQISVTSMNGIVLLTGEVESNEQGRRAIAIARGYTEARQVVNQLTVGATSTLRNRAYDSWLTTKVKTALVRSSDVEANRVKVVTERANVYMLGMVTRREADAAVEATQHLRGVERIVKLFEYIDPNSVQ
jgi:osmotically-inducible protein OsmY